MEKTIAMQDLVYESNPSNILARNRRTESLINFSIQKIERYETSQGAKMVKYTTFCDTIYKEHNEFFVSYGLKGDYTNISLHPSIAATTFNQN